MQKKPFGIGIDTGGTYTDAVVYDFATNKVLAKGKALTTKQDLSIGIAAALASLPQALTKQAGRMALSTTLATNACVEKKGGRAKLVLIGLAPKVLQWVDAKATYGIDPSEVLCVESTSPNWQAITAAENSWFMDAQALSVAAVGALQNGAVLEKEAASFLQAKYQVSLVLANEVASELNVIERGATALLNARLLPVIHSFMQAVQQQGMDMPTMVVRSDGSLMQDSLARLRPVETILSGPAASVLGGCGLTRCPNCLIVDIGGTTTDISIVEENAPVMTGGICIAGWRTQIKGVYIDTFGLGGDSRVLLTEGVLTLSDRRVEPMCVALKRWPQLKDSLRRLLEQEKPQTRPLYEILYLVRQPMTQTLYNQKEQELLAYLQTQPLLLGSGALDLYTLQSERLENEGVIMRCGLTPTDMMHLQGEFCQYDTQGAALAIQYLLKAMGQDFSSAQALENLCEQVMDLACKKLYENIVRVLLTKQHPAMLAKGLGEQLTALIAQGWVEKNLPLELVKTTFSTDLTLVGIGAPTHMFLPKVAKALGAQCVIPDHAAVANAVGAVVADIRVTEKVEISPLSEGAGVVGYAVFTRQGVQRFAENHFALAYAKEAATAAALAEARRRGAIGQMYTKVQVQQRVAYSKEGAAVELGTIVTASACTRNKVDSPS